MEPSRNISWKIFKKFDVHLRSSTKHFQKHFSSRFIVTRIIDSNWHKSLFNSSRPMLYHRYLLTYYLSYEIFGGGKLFDKRRNGLDTIYSDHLYRNKDYVFDQLLRTTARIRRAVSSPKRLSRIRDLLRPRS